MDSDEVLDVDGVVKLTKQSERRVLRALKAKTLKGAPPKNGSKSSAILRSDALQWVRDGAPDGGDK